jgi:hypothetical protein
LAGEACSHLEQYGVRDATTQVAKVINAGGFLPPKLNGKAIVAKSVANWRKRNPRYFHWLFRPEMHRFGEAEKLWHRGEHVAARRAVLRELSNRLKGIKRIWMET